MLENIAVRAKLERTPWIDGNTAWFFWEGEAAPKLVGDFNDWEENEALELEPVGENQWAVQVEFPEDAYIEYTYLDGEERPFDPLNPRRISNGMGKHNQFFYMPKHKLTQDIRCRREIARGQVSAEILEGEDLVVGGKRRVYFYQPPVDEPCPLLLVWDGQDYLRRALLTNIVDNLIHSGRIRPVALAMVEHGHQARMLEYGCSDVTLEFVVDRVLPAARERCNLLDLCNAPGAYGVLGASMGGLMALYTGLRLPQIFGRVLSQSGAFSLGEHDMVVWDLMRAVSSQRMKVWMDAGRLEGLVACNRRMADLMTEKGYEFAYREYSGGHNYTCWRNDLPEGLAFLFNANNKYHLH